jgi:pyruvate dehydrogenase (quinone)
MRTPDDIVPGWERALAADRPVVVQAHTDPEVPPLPPHISFEQAKHFTQSILEGDEAAWTMIKRSAREVLAGRLPGR